MSASYFQVLLIGVFTGADKYKATNKYEGTADTDWQDILQLPATEQRDLL